jgi:hypothetical protein
MNWLTRFLSKRPMPEQRPLTNTPALVTCGIYLSGRDWFLCSPINEQIRGVKIVTVPKELYDRYVKAETEWLRVQGLLGSYPQSLQPRRRSTRKAKVEASAE